MDVYDMVSRLIQSMETCLQENVGTCKDCDGMGVHLAYRLCELQTVRCPSRDRAFEQSILGLSLDAARLGKSFDSMEVVLEEVADLDDVDMAYDAVDDNILGDDRSQVVRHAVRLLVDPGRWCYGCQVLVGVGTKPHT